MRLEEMRNNPQITASIEVIKKDFLEVFPNGYVRVGVRKTIGNPYLSIDLGLIGGEDVANGIRQNDPMYTSLMGHDVSVDGKFVVETLQSGLMCEPEDGSYYAMSRVKTTKRKLNNTLDKQVASLKKYFKTLGETVKQNQDNVYRSSTIDPKYFEINT